MVETLPWIKSASGHERVGCAGGGSTPERRPDVEFIIFFKEGTVNDVENVLIAFIPIEIDAFCGDILQLTFQAILGNDAILILQSLAHCRLVFRPEIP